jgi:hypothetical protein
MKYPKGVKLIKWNETEKHFTLDGKYIGYTSKVRDWTADVFYAFPPEGNGHAFGSFPCAVLFLVETAEKQSGAESVKQV